MPVTRHSVPPGPTSVPVRHRLRFSSDACGLGPPSDSLLHVLQLALCGYLGLPVDDVERQPLRISIEGSIEEDPASGPVELELSQRVQQVRPVELHVLHAGERERGCPHCVVHVAADDTAVQDQHQRVELVPQPRNRDVLQTLSLPHILESLPPPLPERGAVDGEPAAHDLPVPLHVRAGVLQKIPRRVVLGDYPYVALACDTLCFCHVHDRGKVAWEEDATDDPCS
mmetsp:Transcript_45506/g.93067  ORF Transcript_45506/g.93067 Transcript_45506/m.93067 type:complete len:227 (+) Transcript_45506:2357-3037(+)